MRDKKDIPASRRGFLFAAITVSVPAALRAQFKPANPPPDQAPPPGQPAPVLKKAPADVDQAADAQKSPTFSTGVKVVNVFAAVRDKNGQILKDLSKDEFQLKEDDRPQTIQYFSRESNLPLTLGLLIDTSMSQRRVLGDERRASYRFFDQVMREDKDKAAVAAEGIQAVAAADTEAEGIDEAAVVAAPRYMMRCCWVPMT
ncbi:MAG: VWA domain-containing protein [Bryobacteraceae bacterium]